MQRRDDANSAKRDEVVDNMVFRALVGSIVADCLFEVSVAIYLILLFFSLLLTSDDGHGSHPTNGI